MSDFSLTTFAARGKLPQIENALAAVAKGETSLGIKAKNGVVIATEKKLSSPLLTGRVLLCQDPILCDHIGAVVSGLGPDFPPAGPEIPQAGAELLRREVLRARWSAYPLQGRPPNCCRRRRRRRGYRPFGVSVLIAGYDQDGPPPRPNSDPSGAYYNWKATAIGKETPRTPRSS